MTNSILDEQIKQSPLEYREKLTMSSRVKFGLELELDKVDKDEVYRLVKEQIGLNWQVKKDDSLTPGQNAEIVSPVLYNNKQTWLFLKRLSELLKEINPSYDKCSFQINFDSSLLPTTQDKFKFLKLYAMYEDIIYRFSKGEDLKYRDTLEEYASPIILNLKQMMPYGEDAVLELFSNTKRRGVVFKTKDKELVEFRTPNATHNPTLWQNYITTFYYLLIFTTSRKYNEQEIDEYLDNFYKTYLLEYYEQENKPKALKLSNVIFHHNTDKTNFMNQYLGIIK